MSSSALFGKDTSRKTECKVCCGTGAILTTVTVERLIEGEGAGCSLCEILRRAVITHAPGQSSDEGISLCHGLGIYEMVVGKYDDNQVKISVYGHDRPDAPLRSVYEAKGIKETPADTVADIIGNTSSPAAMDKIRGWIENCGRSHEDCKLTTSPPLPTRVLDVGPQKDGMIHLYETNEETEQYICLSHCWGGHQPLKTEVLTIEARKKGINWDELPRTFQDAVVMTRALGIRYLWIDSLCIVQDDEEDWRRESGKMHIIYQGGYLTLAASSSADPDGGLFRDVPSEYSLRDWDLNGQHIRTRRKIPHIDSARDNSLMRRGWVFQERVLSRRVLHFSTAELAWECMEDNDCECGNFYQCLGVGNYELAEKRRYRPIDKMKGWLMFVWWKIVMDYSRMQLSYEKDIFPALSGVAELQRAVRGSTYHAGLWSDTLIYDLLWRVPKNWDLPILEFQYERVARPSEWRAPTWSWASVKSAVEYTNLAGFESKLASCEVEIEHAGESETGQLESATLEVSGLLVEVTVHQPQTNAERQRHRTAYLKFGDLVIHFEEDYDIWGDPNSPIEGGVLFCLLVGKWFEGESSENGYDKLWYMVLNQVDSENDLYERVGVATIPIEEGKFETYKDFLCSLRQTENVCIL
jgi:Heterokaryon incompatibility protein (HET)